MISIAAMWPGNYFDYGDDAVSNPTRIGSAPKSIGFICALGDSSKQAAVQAAHRVAIQRIIEFHREARIANRVGEGNGFPSEIMQ